MSESASSVSAGAHPPQPRRKHPTVSINLPAPMREELERIARHECAYLGAIIRRACAFEISRLKRGSRGSGRSSKGAAGGV